MCGIHCLTTNGKMCGTQSLITNGKMYGIQVWGLSSPQPHFTLEGHEKGVNCLDYFAGGDKPFLISGADDKTVKVKISA
jgi:WD40 repeat protein